MAIKVLLVDDDDLVADAMAIVLAEKGFMVTAANTVKEALSLMSNDAFDVLLSDLHMPGAGDGLTVISAMRHFNPKAVTLLLSAFPEMTRAAQTILSQTDQILVKPVDGGTIANIIHQRLASGPASSRVTESVASILERSIETMLEAWLTRVQQDEKLSTFALTPNQRSGHLRTALMDLVHRLRSSHPLGSKLTFSAAAHEHGRLRREQGYMASMLVEESRLLQVTIFDTLQKNLAYIDFSVLLNSVMAIADEVDSQLSQAMESYNEELSSASLASVGSL